MSLLGRPSGMKAIDVVVDTMNFVRTAAIEFGNQLHGMRSDIKHIHNRLAALEQVVDGQRLKQLSDDIIAIMEKQLEIIQMKRRTK